MYVFKGKDTLSGEATLPTCFSSLLKRKEAPQGSRFDVPFRMEQFSEWTWYTKSKQEVPKVVSHVKYGRKSTWYIKFP